MKRMAVLITLVSLHLGLTSFASSHKPTVGTRPASGVVWFDLMVTDLARTEAFYGSLLGWKTTPQSTNYYLVEAGGVPIGGINVMPGMATGDGISIYFEVQDVKVKLEEAKNLGATVILDPTNFPSGKGAFARGGRD